MVRLVNFAKINSSQNKPAIRYIVISKEKKKCDKIKKDKELLEERIQTLMALIAEKESEGKEQLEAIDCLKEDVEQCNEDMKCV